MFLTALIVAAFAWGTKVSALMLGLAFLAHVTSVADAIRQGAFPGFGKWIPTVSASCGLGFCCYAPALMAASLVAWPEGRAGSDHEFFAVNRWAYRATEPKSGDWVWFRLPNREAFGLGRFVAGPGRSVEWSNGTLRVDGRPLSWLPYAPGGSPIDLSVIVADSQYLIAPLDGTPNASNSAGLIFVSRDVIVGKAWARIYPVWRRRLLF